MAKQKKFLTCDGNQATTHLRYVAVALFTLISIAFCQAQEKNSQLTLTSEVVGKNMLNDAEINAIVYPFSENIYDIDIDTITNLTTVRLRGISKNGKYWNNKGQIIQYDKEKNVVLWTKKFNYQGEYLKQYSKTMIFSNGKKSSAADVYTGQELWKTNNNLYYVNYLKNTGIGYKFNALSDNSNNLQAIDLSAGKFIWERKLSREYGWDNLLQINDSTIIILASGLHLVDLGTGQGWDYNTITGDKDYTASTVTNVIGAAALLLTGTGMFSTGYNLVRDLRSNLVGDSLYFYFASTEQLAKIRKSDGEVIWKFPFGFNENKTGKSTIWLEDSTLYMINYAYGTMGVKQVSYETPFIARFDKETGKHEYFSILKDKKNPILDFILLNDSVFMLVFKNKTTLFNKQTGEIILEKEIDNKRDGDYKYIVGKSAFIENENGKFQSLVSTDTTKVFVVNDKNLILSIDDKMNVVDTVPSENIWKFYGRFNDNVFISKNHLTKILDKEGNIIAELDMGKNIFIQNNYLYGTNNEKLYQINLSELFDLLVPIKQKQNE